MKVQCEVCGNLVQLQHLSENYYRVKHYLGSTDGKLRFEYHKQSLEYIRTVLDNVKEGNVIDPIDQKHIDPNNLKSSLNNQNRNGNSDASIAQSVEQQPCKL